MERLTERVVGGIRIKGCSTLYADRERKGDPAANAIVRLAAYEDTGLTPEEIDELLHKSNGQLHQKIGQWLQAKQDGRLVALPCGIGDAVYHITTCENFPQILDGTMYGSDGGPGTATGCYCPCELAENCPFDAEDFDCNKNKKKFAVFEDEVVSFCSNGTGTTIALSYSGSVSAMDFGKTVFLTREEAEAALEKRENSK